ncbi:MAG: SigB/SigF/SigG family RNA polymerase sigma factor [Halanaerobiaceae bacterium]
MGERIIDLPEVPLLEEDETRKYIEEAQAGGREALNKLVKHNLRLVLKITYRFKNTDYDLRDLFQIGVIGLIKAVKGFDLERGVKFSTYAVSRILGEIRLHLRDDEMIRVSRSLKKRARDIKKKQEEMVQNLNREPAVGELAAEMDCSREEIVRALEADKEPHSIYQTIYDDGGRKLTLLDSLGDDKDQEREHAEINKLALREELEKLNKRERLIIYLRYFEGKTQEEIGEIIGVSQVQVSRLERKILKKLKQEF